MVGLVRGRTQGIMVFFFFFMWRGFIVLLLLGISACGKGWFHIFRDNWLLYILEVLAEFCLAKQNL